MLPSEAFSNQVAWRTVRPALCRGSTGSPVAERDEEPPFCCTIFPGTGSIRARAEDMETGCPSPTNSDGVPGATLQRREPSDPVTVQASGERTSYRQYKVVFSICDIVVYHHRLESGQGICTLPVTGGIYTERKTEQCGRNKRAPCRSGKLYPSALFCPHIPEKAGSVHDSSLSPPSSSSLSCFAVEIPIWRKSSSWRA